MADSVASQVVEAANATLSAVANATAEATASAGGDVSFIVAYMMLIVMASGCVYVGCHHSLKEKTEEERGDVMTTTDAAMFPLYASVFLFGLYLIFKFFGQGYINMLLTFYFFMLGVMSVAGVLGPLIRPYVAVALSVDHLPTFRLCFTKSPKQPVKSAKDSSAKADPAPTDAKDDGAKSAEAAEKENAEELFDLAFDYSHVVAHVVGCALGGWYIYEKHWIANNIFGMCFAISGIELISLGSYQVGCILLGGLFVYDVFWVFGTDVMVTVAKSFEAPIKLLFPKDCATNLFRSKAFAMLGLGDIVVPGIFIALLLRFDRSRQNDATAAVFSKTYFNLSFAGYVAGLLTTFVVMHAFNAAQPALLYLVPACLATSAGTAYARREFGLLLKYNDNPTENGKKTE